MNNTTAMAVKFVENNPHLNVKEWGKGMQHHYKPLAWAMNEVVTSSIERPDANNYTIFYKNAVVITKDGYGRCMLHGVTVGHAISKAGINIDNVKKVVIVENYETCHSGKIVVVRRVTEYHGKESVIRKIIKAVNNWVR